MPLLQSLRFAADIYRQIKATDKSVKQLKDVQAARLRSLVRHAVGKSDFYRQKYRGINLQRFELSELPPTNKSEIRDNFESVVTDPRIRLSDLRQFVSDERNLGKWHLGEYAIAQTSGSQGEPLMIVQHRRAVQLILALMVARCPARPTYAEGVKRLFAPRRVVAISFRRGFYSSGTVLEHLQELTGSTSRLIRLSSTQPDLLERLNDAQPEVIVGNAGVLEGIAIRADRLRLKKLTYLSSSSEQLTAAARARIEEGFNAPVYDHYAAGECLHLSDTCRTCQGLHVNLDWAILEVVDENNQPVPDGETGTKVLITNLANFAQPFIRYELGDRVALAVDNNCPRNPLPRIERLEGRATDVLCVGGKDSSQLLSSALFVNVFADVPAVRDYRVIQREPERLEFQLVLHDPSAVHSTNVENQLMNVLRKYGILSTIRIDVSYVSEIAPDPRTGKVRRTINEVGSPDANRLIGSTSNAQ